MRSGFGVSVLAAWPASGLTWAFAAGLSVALIAGGNAASNMAIKKDEGFQTSVPAALVLQSHHDELSERLVLFAIVVSLMPPRP